jgi:LysR family transcriptional regulator, hydrogen peroxide-inducible genes activator
MPSLRQFEYLLALEEHRHFRRAAEHCGVSQPTLSAQLCVLEDRLGAQLVERSRSRVLMTPIGTEIAAVARRVLRDVEEMRHLADRPRSGIGGTVRIGLAPTIGPYLLPKMIPDLHAAYPDLKLHVREDFPDALPPALEEGRHDVLVVPLPVDRKELETEPIFREPLYLAMAVDHPLASRKWIDRRALRGQSVLTLESGHQLYGQVKRLCDEVGAKTLSDYEGTSLDTLREMVGMGMGLSFLPGLFVKSSLVQNPTIKVVEVKGAPIYRLIGMVWRKSSSRGEEFRTLAEHCRTTIRREFPEFPIM